MKNKKIIEISRDDIINPMLENNKNWFEDGKLALVGAKLSHKGLRLEFEPLVNQEKIDVVSVEVENNEN